MDIYEYISDITAAVVGLFTDNAAVRFASRVQPELVALVGSDGVAQSISVAQTVSAVLSAAFAFLLVVAVIRKRHVTGRPSDEAVQTSGDGAVSEPVAGPLRARWEVVRAHLESPHSAEWKEAVMEADKLVDDALAKAGFPGDTFGDRLTNIQPGALVSLDGIWWAHRIRNRLAHELDYFLRFTEARQAVGYYEQALSELQLL